MPRPSMLDGLHWKLLGNGFDRCRAAAGPAVWLTRQQRGAGRERQQTMSGRTDSIGKFTPFDSTVMPAPSSAPISVGSCSSSARLPLSVASQPTVASSGNRSTCGLIGRRR